MFMADFIEHYPREHPQWSFSDTTIDSASILGRIRGTCASATLKVQLDHMKRTGCYDIFSGKFMPCYEVRRLYGAKALSNGLPPSLFWESDIGKWQVHHPQEPQVLDDKQIRSTLTDVIAFRIESVSYFLANSSSEHNPHVQELTTAVDKLVDEMEAFQQVDGYLNVYFTVVDPTGRFRNLRDMHEMYNAGHLLEGAIAHYRATRSRKFLNIMLKNVDCFIAAFGPGESQRPGYPGHPELELALLRLYAITKDPRHLNFVEHLLTARGTCPQSLGHRSYFSWEARERNDRMHGGWMKGLDDLAYHQAHRSLHHQEAIVGHSVRAMYLLTACADFGGDFLEDAKRLWTDATGKKMYITGGFGSEPWSEGFSELEYYLPSSTGEGGCYAETCASVGAMMLSERLLSQELRGKYRDVLELCLYNAVLGGGSLDGKSFSYTNKLATYGDESALRADWFEVCCCPPNLSRTLGMLPGYVWSTNHCEDVVEINIYLYSSSHRKICLPSGRCVDIAMWSGMPWEGDVRIDVCTDPDTTVHLRLPVTGYMLNTKFSIDTESYTPGFVQTILDAGTTSMTISFDMAVRLVYPNVAVGQDTLSVVRGPVVFVAEDVDNTTLEECHPHFELLGLSESATFRTVKDTVAKIPILKLTTSDVYELDQAEPPVRHANVDDQSEPSLWRDVLTEVPVRSWRRAQSPLTFVPWFTRGNRGGKGHLRVPFMRVGRDVRR